jgi:aminopeptidase N
VSWSLFLSVVLALPAAFAGPRDGNPPSRHGLVMCSRAKAAFAAEAAARLTPVWARAVEETAAETDVQHYALELEIAPPLNWLGGVNRVTVTSMVEGLQRFRFWLSDRLTIESVTIDGTSAPWQRLDEATVEVALDPPRSPGQTVVVAITYAGYPELDTPGISFETRNGHPEVTTRSEPWYAYIWWPVKEDNRDKATADITLIVPEDLVGVSNGLLVDTFTADGKRHIHWRTRYPTAPYLFFVSVTNYTTFSDVAALDGRLMPLQFYIRPEEDTPEKRQQWLRTKYMLQAFGTMFGTYPFIDEKYGIYQFSHGGMEHQTISGQTGFSEDVTSHELAHQWWGDMVTCATWHDIWLNEGFATYAEALWLEHEAGQNGSSVLKTAMAARRPKDASGSVYVQDIGSASPLFTELTYQKGAWVLHMLRHVLGDDAFFATLRRYGAEHAYGTATTEDLRAAAEEVAGRDLKWFFDEWVYGGGAPAYAYAWRENVVAGQRNLELYVGQDQVPAGRFFEMPLDVRIATASGSSTVSLWNSAAQEHYVLPVSAPVDSVTLDPGGWILATGTRLVPFVERPPKIIDATPGPGGAAAEGHLHELTVTFDEDVVADASDFTLVGEQRGEVSLAFAYDYATTTARLVPEKPLAPDQYVLTVSDAVTGAVSGERLDGEVGAGSGPDALPSGDGTAGGIAVIHFAIFRSPRLHLRSER